LKLGLWTLEERRNRSDLIEMYKLLHGLTTISYDKFFELATDKRTRGHSLTLIKHRFATVVRQHFFSERVINRWNALDDDTVTASSLNNFKARLNKFRSMKMGFFSWTSVYIALLAKLDCSAVLVRPHQVNYQVNNMVATKSGSVTALSR